MNAVRRFSLAPCESRSSRPKYGVRTQAVCRMKKVLFAMFVLSADHAAPVQRNAISRRQRSPSPGHTPPRRKQSP
jgi:hypothetical protein